MKITNRKLIDILSPSITELGKIKTKNLDLIIANTKAREVIEKSNKDFDEVKKALIESYCKLDVNGSPILLDGRNYTFESKEIKAELINKIEELLNKEIEIKIDSIDIKAFAGMELTEDLVKGLKDCGYIIIE